MPLTDAEIAAGLRMEAGGRLLRRTYRRRIGYCARVGDCFERSKTFAHFPEGMWRQRRMFVVLAIRGRWVHYRILSREQCDPLRY